MKKAMNSYFLVGLATLLTAPNILARSTPAGFESFFSESIETVEVSIAGVTFSQSANALVSYESFQLTQSNADALAVFLKNNSIKASEISHVIAELTDGIRFNAACEDGCYANNQLSQAKYWFDFDNRALTIFASSEMFDFTMVEEYHSPFRQSNALINETNLYVFANDHDSNFNWSNDTTLGLPYGHINFDTQYTHQQQDLNVITGVYDLDLSGHRIVAGYQQLGSRYNSFNSSDFLHYGSDYTGYAVNVGSSDNLLKGSKHSRLSLDFYTPQSGQLEIYRDGRLIYSQAVKQGQNAINYDELPRGVYTINLLVKQGEQELLNESRSIVNNNDSSLLVGDFDYRVRAGQLDKGAEYAEASLSHRWSEKSLLGVALGSDFTTQMVRLGAKYYVNDITTLQYMANVFDSGSWYQQGQISIGSLGLNARRIEGVKESDDFSRALYGESDTSEYGISYTTQLFGGSAYTSFYRLDIDNDDFELKSDNLSFSWNRKLLGGQFSLSTNYAMQEDKDDAFSVGVNWSYDFTDTISYASSVSVNDDGFDYVAQDFTLSNSWDEHDASLTVRAKSQDERLINELSAFGSGSNEAMRYNSYAFYSTDKHYSASGTIKSTQILTTNDVAVTSKTGRSFVKVNPQWTSTPENETEIAYSIYKDGKHNYGGTVASDESFIVSLPVYSDVRFELDTEYSGVEVDVKSKENFTTPGTHYEINNRVTPLRSQVFLLNDIDGNSIPSAVCAGEGCKSVNDVTDGVYRVTYREEQSFHLLADNRICVFNPEHFGNTYVHSYCLEGLNDIDDSSSIVYNDMKYIGVYQSTDATLKIIQRLEELGLASRYVAVGNQLYVYVRYESEFTVAQVQTLGQLETHLVSTKFKPENMFSVTKL